MAGPNWEALSVVIVVLGAAFSWFLMRRKQSKISKLLVKIDSEYMSYKMKPKQCEAELYSLREEITESFKKGKIDMASFSILDKRLDGYLSEVRGKVVDDNFKEAPSKIKNQVLASLEDGEVSEAEYETFKKLLEKSKGIDAKTKAKLKDVVANWKKKDSKGKEKKKLWIWRILAKIPWNLKRIGILNIILGAFLTLTTGDPIKKGDMGGAIILLLIGITLITSGILNILKKRWGIKISKFVYWILLVLGVIIIITQFNIVGVILLLISASVLYHLKQTVTPMKKEKKKND